MEPQTTTDTQKHAQLTSWKRLILVTTMLFSGGLLPVIALCPVAYADAASPASPASPASYHCDSSTGCNSTDPSTNSGKTKQQENLLNQASQGNSVNQSNQAGQARDITQTNERNILICKGHGKIHSKNLKGLKGNKLSKMQNGNIIFICV